VIQEVGDGCTAQLLGLDGAVESERKLPECPASVEGLEDGIWFMRSSVGRWYSRSIGELAELPANAVQARSRDNYVLRSEDELLWVSAGSRRKLPPEVTPELQISGANSIFAIARGAAGETIVRIDADGGSQPLFEPIRRVESFDVSPDGREVIFAGDRSGNLDVGLVSAASGEIRWIGPDPAPERGVSWAPRGNKVSWIVETATGALIRTVHIPTAYQVAVDLPFASAQSLSWEPKAERFAYVKTSLADGTSIETIRYGGEDRRTLVAPTGGFAGEADVLMNAGVSANVFAPGPLRYGERRPVVVWVVSPAEASTAARYDIPGSPGHIVITAGNPEVAFWDALSSLSWIDPARIFVVDMAGRAMAAPGRGVTRIGVASGSDALSAGALREGAWGDRDTQVTLAPADAARVIPFAAAYITEKISRNARANGSG
jgi:dipeptidyl aminopeptidase/acylaminoacyl peptidase